MAALVQSYPQQSGTVTMLQTRPASASGMMPSGQPQGQPYGGGNQAQRNSFYGGSGPVGGQAVYRGSSGPIQPYAFTATPSLHPNAQWQQTVAMRTASSPVVPTMHSFDGANAGGRPRYPASVSMSHLPGTFAGGYHSVGSRDDSSLPSGAVGGRRFPAAPRPQSAAYLTGATTATATQVTFTQATPVKVSPERYRRQPARAADGGAGPSPQARLQVSAQPSGSGMATIGHLYNSQPNMARSRTPSATNSRPNSVYSSNNTSTTSSTDDMQLFRQQQPQDEFKRLRRRSMPALDSADFPKPLAPHDNKQSEESSRLEHSSPSKSADREPKSVRIAASTTAAAGNGKTSPVGDAAPSHRASHARNGSSESLTSSHSNVSRPSSSANRNSSVSPPAGTPAASTSGADQTSSTPSPDYPRLVNIPPRSSSSDASKNVLNPSPLSRPMTMESDSDAVGKKAVGDAVPSPGAAAESPRNAGPTSSPAVQQLSAISQKTGTAKLRSKTSRLRRAFSFGSAAEFRKATIPEDSVVDNVQGGPPTKLHKEPTSDELYETEQDRIAQQQEAAGIGHSIYAGAKIFAGSTDNLSISSTASSASIMIRKMGRGMKKSTRSLVGLFRPKSIIGAPAADPQPSEASQAAVSMITVEAERERVNVNADPHSQNGGGTGFPRLERNSLEASQVPSLTSDRVGSPDTDNSGARRSIIGGDKERAEVLAAMRKGILKHRIASNSPPRGQSTVVVASVPAMSDSPNSSAPSTPNDENQGHKRSGSVAIGSEDYFVTAMRLRQDTRSAPVTPQGGTPTGTMRRNATFSPRIVFYETWPSQEYDRRGEISTCNRLTPMLAQQIKEELNSFKMEMEVHETSKIYTHFF